MDIWNVYFVIKKCRRLARMSAITPEVAINSMIASCINA